MVDPFGEALAGDGRQVRRRLHGAGIDDRRRRVLGRQRRIEHDRRSLERPLRFARRQREAARRLGEVADADARQGGKGARQSEERFRPAGLDFDLQFAHRRAAAAGADLALIERQLQQAVAVAHERDATRHVADEDLAQIVAAQTLGEGFEACLLSEGEIGLRPLQPPFPLAAAREQAALARRLDGLHAAAAVGADAQEDAVGEQRRFGAVVIGGEQPAGRAETDTAGAQRIGFQQRGQRSRFDLQLQFDFVAHAIFRDNFVTEGTLE